MNNHMGFKATVCILIVFIIAIMCALQTDIENIELNTRYTEINMYKTYQIEQWSQMYLKHAL